MTCLSMGDSFVASAPRRSSGDAGISPPSPSPPLPPFLRRWKGDMMIILLSLAFPDREQGGQPSRPTASHGS